MARFGNLVPNQKALSNQIKITASKTTYDHKIVYSFSEILKAGKTGEETTWIKKKQTGRKEVHP